MVDAPMADGYPDDDALHVWFRATNIFSNLVHTVEKAGTLACPSNGGGVQILSGHVTFTDETNVFMNAAPVGGGTSPAGGGVAVHGGQKQRR